MKNNSNYYFEISLLYEIPNNILESTDPNLLEAKEAFFEKIENIIPKESYEIFKLKLAIYQLRDTNYIVEYSALFRSTVGLPMEEYVRAKDLKEKVKAELELFFSSVDCDYRQIAIKTLL